jgi:4-alpha-glucanotransferase
MAQKERKSNTDVWGVDRGYEDTEKVWHETSAETHRAILAAMGAADESAPPNSDSDVRVITPGANLELDGPVELTLEDGTRLDAEHELPPDLPLGYHELRTTDGRTTRLIVSPGQCLLPPAARAWGWAAQLYATRSENSWGLGDLADLRRLARWAAGQEAGVVLVNPLSAPAPTLPQETSPYYPISRRFRNPLYLRVEEVAGAGGLGEQLGHLAAAGRALNADPRLDRDAVFRLKHEALELIWSRFAGDAAFDDYRRAQGPGLEQFAIFCALSERHGGDWRGWPADLHRPDSPAVREFAAAQSKRILYHQWLQWLLDDQLARASAPLPIMHDLPIGVNPGGSDAWSWQDVLATGCSVGAPPDMYNTQGQNWGLPPLVPHKLRAAGYEPFIQTIRSSLRHAGALRIDHVMGLFRLFWIPDGMGPQQGAFVRYRADEMLAIVALESQRAGAYVVGEDLGTVEDGVREQLAAHRVLSYRLLWFEADSPRSYPKLAMVAVTTHDLPTIAGLWTGNDLAAQQQIGLKPNEEATGEMRQRLADMAGLSDDAPASTVIDRAYGLLAQAPSLIITATLEDALEVEDRTNMPGTTTQWPNWSIALPGGLEALERSPRAAAIAQTLGRRSRKWLVVSG